MKRPHPSPTARNRLLARLRPIPLDDPALWAKLRSEGEAAARYAALRGRECERMTPADMMVRFR